MNVFRSILHSVVLFSVAAAAPNAFAKKQTLDEFMSPDELANEIGLQNLTDWSWSQVEGEAPRLEILVDKGVGGVSDTAQRTLVYLDGQLLYRFKSSSGREKVENSTKSGRKYFSATPLGSYGFYHRTVNHHSTLWDADMPYAQFFNNGVAIHATTQSHYAELGQRASGGCVRLSLPNAEKLYRLVNCLGSESSGVTVFQSTRANQTPAELVGRQTNTDVEPTFRLNCSTFQDTLVLPDGREVLCKETRSDYKWEARECGIKKSVARNSGIVVPPGGIPSPVIDGPSAEEQRIKEEARRLEEARRDQEERLEQSRRSAEEQRTRQE